MCCLYLAVVKILMCLRYIIIERNTSSLSGVYESGYVIGPLLVASYISLRWVAQAYADGSLCKRSVDISTWHPPSCK